MCFCCYQLSHAYCLQQESWVSSVSKEQISQKSLHEWYISSSSSCVSVSIISTSSLLIRRQHPSRNHFKSRDESTTNNNSSICFQIIIICKRKLNCFHRWVKISCLKLSLTVIQLQQKRYEKLNTLLWHTVVRKFNVMAATMFLVWGGTKITSWTIFWSSSPPSNFFKH